ALADLALGARVVRVVAHERRHVEGDGEARLAALEEELVALVRVLRGAEARELPHGPEAAAVEVRMDAAREGELAREAELLEVARGRLGLVLRGVEHVHRLHAQRLEARLARLRGVRLLLPVLKGALDRVHAGSDSRPAS